MPPRVCSGSGRSYIVATSPGGTDLCLVGNSSLARFRPSPFPGAFGNALDHLVRRRVQPGGRLHDLDRTGPPRSGLASAVSLMRA